MLYRARRCTSALEKRAADMVMLGRWKAAALGRTRHTRAAVVRMLAGIWLSRRYLWTARGGIGGARE